MAVFRFTLGIPGFDDTYIPRVIGALGILVLFANHFFGSNATADAQVSPRSLYGWMSSSVCCQTLTEAWSCLMQIRSELFAAILAAICIASPTIEARLKELEPGRGRQAAPQQVQGATSIFAIAAKMPENQKQVDF